MDQVPTIKVRPWGEGQGEYVEINESDFDPAIHEPFEVGSGAPLAAPGLDSPAPKKAPAKRRAKPKAKK